HMGAVGIASAAVTTIVMFMVVSIATSVSTGQSAGAILAKIALTFVYLIVMAAVVRPLLDRAARSYRESGVLASGFFAILFITLTASGVFAELLGLTVMVGGFMAGMVLPARKQLFADMEERVGELTVTILLPIFLAFSGLGTDFTRLSGAAFSGLVILLIAAIAAKWVGGAVFARLSGLSWAEGNVLGILMNCRGLMVLVVALAGVQNGVITPVMQLGGVLIALITTAMTGPLFDRYISSIPEAHDPHVPTIETAGPG
ncbi:MAG: cation:proton antiporter, partial [Acidimicrobiia bacterium]|nr:cation:proton antiporter [Acidimicrobiia bacterium]